MTFHERERGVLRLWKGESVGVYRIALTWRDCIDMSPRPKSLLRISGTRSGARTIPVELRTFAVA